MNINAKFLLCLLPLWGLTLPLWAQMMPEPAETEGQEYELKEITVQGFVLSDSASIISRSGLKAGDKIRIPSDDLNRAIRNIWKENLFTDVRIDVQKIVADGIYLQIGVTESARLSRHGYAGVPKSQHDDLNKLVSRYLIKGRVANAAMRKNAITEIAAFYEEKGFYDVTIDVTEQPDEIYGEGYVRWVFNIKKGKRIKIQDIVFVGNQKVKSGKLRRLMKETKRYLWYNIFKKSKLLAEEYEADKKKIVAYYQSKGMRDAQIVSDSVKIITDSKGKKSLLVEIKIDEGNIYYFGNISFRGNTSYPSKDLIALMDIKRGDIFSSDLLNSRISFDKNGRDISTLYMDNGHLFFRAEPIEKGINNDTVDVEIRISEGPVAIIDKVIITGNDRTHEHVIRRELRTLPGDKFSRSDIIRSQRELMALNYFNPETMSINTPVNPQNGTVNIEYGVEERPADQLEMSAGWGGRGRGVIGTMGVTFNNFSLRNVLKPKLWSPLPQGDGQRLSLRAQTNGTFFQSYNFSFTEPWLGNRRPMALSLSAYHQRQSYGVKESSTFQQFLITGASVGIGTRLRIPDDYFLLQASVDYQNMRLTNQAFFIIPTGNFHNLALNLNFSRNSISNPTFPTSGASISFGIKATLPYSLILKRDYANMLPEDKFKMVEYHKWDIKTDWYTALAKNLVFRANAKMGFLGYYNSQIGLSPFERYELGGDGISNFIGLQGKTIISMRGYKEPLQVSEANRYGAAIYNKFTAELRYLISPNPSATFYLTAFAQAGNSWNNMKEYNPFNLRRSVGLGLRAFLPMFGTLGFDYGIGFDKNLPAAQNIFDYGSFNIILGFEPE